MVQLSDALKNNPEQAFSCLWQQPSAVVVVPIACCSRDGDRHLDDAGIVLCALCV